MTARRVLSTTYDRKDDTGLVYRWSMRDRHYAKRPISREMAAASLAWRKQEAFDHGWSEAVEKALHDFAIRWGLN